MIDWKKLTSNLNGTIKFLNMFFRLKPEIHKPKMSKPYCGTIFISILSFAPTNRISEFLSLESNSLAIEIAG